MDIVYKRSGEIVMGHIRGFVLAALVLATPVAVGAQVPLGTPEVQLGTGRIDLPLGETTTVKGKGPLDLVGYWLVSENHELAAGRIFPGLQLYRVGQDGKGQLQVNWLEMKWPSAVQAKLRQAQEGQQAWSPDKDDIAAIAAAVAADPPVVDPKRRGMHVITAAKQFDDKIKKAPESKGATLAIQSLFQPTDKPPYGQSYYVARSSKDELGGQFTMGAIPMNPKGIPIPMGTKGAFRWIRLSVPKVAAAPASETVGGSKAQKGRAD